MLNKTKMKMSKEQLHISEQKSLKALEKLQSKAKVYFMFSMTDVFLSFFITDNEDELFKHLKVFGMELRWEQVRYGSAVMRYMLKHLTDTRDEKTINKRR